jgi:hypothetical protein
MMHNKQEQVNIWMTRSQETILYAAQELCKYMGLMSQKRDMVRLNKEKAIEGKGLKLGIFTDFSLMIDGIDDPDRDDAIYIDVKDSDGIIAGSNPRSVLFAVYRFLQENGCQWIRPGKNGELVPSRDVGVLNCQITDKAFSRFRGNQNGGIYSIEHYLEKIEWMPKVGLNTFFNEFLLNKKKFNSWYRHEYHSLKTSEQRSDIELTAYNDQVVKEIKKRGLIYQTIGHGWTALFFGLSGIGAEDQTNFIKRVEGETHYLAMVDGKRETNRHGPRFTELCYGNPEVRAIMVKRVADYAEENPEVDFLHFWLGDMMNVHCECELCIDTRPSDFYVMMLNMIDEELAARGITTRIVFLIYQDLIWAPVKQHIKNPDRFVMMFAPIARNYSKPYTLEADKSLLAEFVYNKNAQPSKIGGFMAALKDWQKCFSGEAFSYDYHMTWYHYFDQGYYGFTKVMAEDIRRLEALGLSGFVSCQTMRASFPHSFPLHVHARYLWNPQEDFDKFAAEYFESAFGNDGKLCLAYMKELSELFCPDCFFKASKESSILFDQSVHDKVSRIPDVIHAFRPTVEKNLACEAAVQAESWKLISIHTGIALMLSYALRSLIEGKQEVADAYWTHTVEYIMANEERTENAFDPWWMFQGFEQRKSLLKFKK